MKRGIFLKFIAMLSAAFMLLGISPVAAVVHAVEQYPYEGDMNLDVVFVADVSGSMQHADKAKLMPQVINQFIDMTDGTCRAGYVPYSHVIDVSQEHELVSVADTDGIEQVKADTKAVEYRSDADTDISLGLTEALRIHERGAGQTGRQPIVILLSDGNTDLPKGPRTEEESAAELENTLSSFANSGIKVYTIGLNCDGRLDTDEMQRIADTTSALTFETDSAENLQGIINSIFADCLNIDIIHIDDDEITKEDTGETNESGEALSDYSKDFDVPNSSVYLVNIVIQSSRGVSNPRLYSPEGQAISIDDTPDIVVKESEKYTVIKLFNPTSGTWNLKVRGLTEDSISIDQLSSYSFYVEQNVDSKSVVENTDVNITASLFEKDGIIKDEDLLSDVTAVCSVTGAGNSDAVKLEYTGDGVFSGKYHINQVGSYMFQTTIQATNKSFTKQSKLMTINASNIWDKADIKQGFSAEEVTEGDKLTVSATMNADGKSVDDSLQLSGYSVKCIITDSENQSFEYPMKEENGTFITDIVPPAPDSYKIYTVFEDNATGETKSSNPENISVLKAPLTVKKANDTITVKSAPNPKSETIFPENYFSASASDEITISADTDSEFFSIETSENQITINGLKAGEGSFDIIVSSNRGEQISVTIDVCVESGWKIYIYAGAGIAGILVLILLIYLMVRPKLKKNSVSLAISVPENMNSMGVPPKQTLSLPKKHSANLYSILHMPQNSYALDTFKEYIDKLSLGGVLKNTKFVAVGKRKVKVVIYASEKNKYIVNADEISAKKTVTVGDGGTDRLDIKPENNSRITIEYSR